MFPAVLEAYLLVLPVPDCNAGIPYCQRIWRYWIIRNLYGMSNQSWGCFILPSMKTDTSAFVNFSVCVMQKSFRNNRRIKEGQWSGIPVEFLQRSNAFWRNFYSHAGVVFGNGSMTILVIILVQVNTPESIKFFKCTDFFEFYLAQECIYYLMELFDVDESLFSKNKVTVVNFWFSGCKPCVEELSKLNELNDKIKKMGGEVVGINTDTLDDNQDGIKEAKDILKSQGVSYKNLTFASDSTVGKYAGNIIAFPPTVLVDKSGNIISEPFMGGIDDQANYEQLMKQIQSILDQK